MNLLYPAYFKCVRPNHNSDFKRVPIRKRVYPFNYKGREFFAHRTENSFVCWEVRDRLTGIVVVDGYKKVLKTKKGAIQEFYDIMDKKTDQELNRAYQFVDEQIKTITEIIVEV